MYPSVSLVITSFNRHDALRSILNAIESQTVLPNQVLIADDGSDPSSRNVAEEFSDVLNITYCWQSNRSFRAARARNLAILRGSEDYIIFIDGDCFIPREFVEMHLKFSKRKKIVAGSRILLSSENTESVIRSLSPRFEKIYSLKQVYIPLGFFRNLAPKNWKIVRTCNMSAFRDDVITVFGFDERYVGWGREDSDFVVRLLRSGCKITNGRLGTYVLHLDHKREDKAKLSENHHRFTGLLNSSDSANKIKSCLKNI
jgi:glycosyltransferase involved in cell wall biosynthesis